MCLYIGRGKKEENLAKSCGDFEIGGWPKNAEP